MGAQFDLLINALVKILERFARKRQVEFELR